MEAPHSRDRSDEDIRLPPAGPSLAKIRRDIDFEPESSFRYESHHRPTLWLFLLRKNGLFVALFVVLFGIAGAILVHLLRGDWLWYVIVGISVAFSLVLATVWPSFRDRHQTRRLREALRRFSEIPLALGSILEEDRASLDSPEEFVRMSAARILNSAQTMFSSLTGTDCVASLKLVYTKSMDTDGHPSKFRVIHAYGNEARRLSEPATLPIRGSLAGHVFETKKSVYVHDNTDIGIRRGFKDNWWPDRLDYVRSEVLVPVLSRGDAIAVFNVDSREAGAFDEACIPVAHLVANVLALVFDISEIELPRPHRSEESVSEKFRKPI